MDWILEKCSKCNTWKPIGTKEQPDIFGFLWEGEGEEKICPACTPKPEFNLFRCSVRFMPGLMPRIETRGVFVSEVMV